MSFDLARLPRPIVVVGTPRSGTSLTAGLFARHGVWTGRCMAADDRNSLGYFENLDVKQALLKHCGRLVNEGRQAPQLPAGEWAQEMIYALTAGDYERGPWLAKHSALYWRAWISDFHPIWVCCYRDPDEIAASGKASGLLHNAGSIKAHHAVMDFLCAEYGAHAVWPCEFIEHRWTALGEAFAEAGLAFDHETAEDFVDPSLWHDWSEDIAPA